MWPNPQESVLPYTFFFSLDAPVLLWISQMFSFRSAPSSLFPVPVAIFYWLDSKGEKI